MSIEIRHIYLVDDDPDDHLILSTVLQEMEPGIKLTCFQSCDRLLAAIHQEKDLPDLIVLDLNMPAVDGHKCLSCVKNESKFKHIPVVIYSTAMCMRTAELARKAGAHTFLVKASSKEGLEKMVRELLNVSRREIKGG